jgi:hypothetical protein
MRSPGEQSFLERDYARVRESSATSTGATNRVGLGHSGTSASYLVSPYQSCPPLAPRPSRPTSSSRRGKQSQEKPEAKSLTTVVISSSTFCTSTISTTGSSVSSSTPSAHRSIRLATSACPGQIDHVRLGDVTQLHDRGLQRKGAHHWLSGGAKSDHRTHRSSSRRNYVEGRTCGI